MGFATAAVAVIVGVLVPICLVSVLVGMQLVIVGKCTPGALMVPLAFLLLVATTFFVLLNLASIR